MTSVRGLLGLGALAACAMFAANALGSHGCQAKPIPLVLGFDTQISISTSAGTPCPLMLRTGGIPLDELSVEAQPQHGTVTARGRTGVVYRPSPAFKGEDTFAFSVRGSPSARSETSVVRVRAIVR